MKKLKFISVLLLLCFIMSASLSSQDFCDADQCRQLEFTPEKAFEGKRLINHVVRAVKVRTMNFCENMCYMEPDCVSINLDTRVGLHGGYNCELNNVIHEGHELDLREEENYFYRAAESVCAENPCDNNATCQSGFTAKGYRCLCTTGFRGQDCKKDINECAEGLHSCSADAECSNTKGSYNCACKPGYSGDGKNCKSVNASTCKEVYERNGLKMSGVITLQFGSGPVSVFCHMGDFGCGNGGWTPVMKIDGNKQTFHYDSLFWSNTTEYNRVGGLTGFDSQETKLPTFWNTSFSKICLGMKIGTQINFVVISKRADSLYSLIADGQYRNISLSRDTWKKLIGSEASLQLNCNKEGFNVYSSIRHSKARIGIISNEQDDCSSCDSRIGFGTGGNPDKSITCGNVAKYLPDNMKRYIKAMGYILVH